jgi:methionine synthase II (cobalamin-independent)
LDVFGMSSEYAAGFAGLMEKAESLQNATMLKGQVTGPFTFGTNLLDQDLRCAYYDEQLRDVIVKTVALKSVWQIRQLSQLDKPIMIFIDEPSLLSYGSQTFITVSKEDIISDLNEVARAIHKEGAWVGVHCEADTDWTILMEADLDVLVFDAFDHMQGMTLYPRELIEFLEGGGALGWGIVPTLDKDSAATETLDSLIERFEAGLQMMEDKGVSRELLLDRAFLTPSCGAGGILDEPLAERVFGLLADLSTTLRQEHKFANH